jgi:hypothetical protein
LAAVQEETSKEKEKWQLKLDALNTELDKANDRVYQDTKLCLKKDWADKAAAHRRGGARRCPIWVVQLICELLVNGTSPAAIPSNIQTMYETLYGEKPDELPSVNFVRGCCGASHW